MKTLLQQEEQITDGFQHHFFTFDLLSNPLLLYSVLLHTCLKKEKYNLQDPAFDFFLCPVWSAKIQAQQKTASLDDKLCFLMGFKPRQPTLRNSSQGPPDSLTHTDKPDFFRQYIACPWWCCWMNAIASSSQTNMEFLSWALLLK